MTPELAKQRRWPLAGVIVGPFLVGVPLVVFLFVTLSINREMATGTPDPRQIVEQGKLMMFAGLALFIFIPLGGAAFIFSVIRLARLRRQTPPKLPPAIPPNPGEPT